MIESVQTLQIEVWPIDRFVLYARNPRKNDAAVDRMVASIREFGFKIPVLAQRRNRRGWPFTTEGGAQVGIMARRRHNHNPVILCDEWTDAQVLDGLLRIGFLHHQQIIWNKGRTVLTRTHYWFQHEPYWYVRKKNAPWFGKAVENSTIWDSPSPKFIMADQVRRI
jgi:hypothetical protein